MTSSWRDLSKIRKKIKPNIVTLTLLVMLLLSSPAPVNNGVVVVHYTRRWSMNDIRTLTSIICCFSYYVNVASYLSNKIKRCFTKIVLCVWLV